MDSSGDHAVFCAATGLAKRHNRIRDCLLLLGRDAGWNPELEVSLTTSDPGGGTLHPRPVDVLFRTAESRPLAVDVTVVQPLRPCNNIVAVDNCAAAANAENAKSVAQAPGCHRAGSGFIPFALETTGGFGPKATTLFKRICRTASIRSGEPIAEVLGIAAALLSVALAKGRA